jgi:hypothetical protein
VYLWRSSQDPVDLAFTDRYGGVSAAPYDELNLGTNTADTPSQVAQNLELVTTDFAPGAALAVPMRQVHGAEVAYVERRDSPSDRELQCDGQVTDQTDLVLVVRVADCVPVLLADPATGVIGVAHAGRSGLVAGVVPATVARMRESGAADITAWLGPHICGACYEVPAAMQEEVVALVPESRATTSWGTPALDIGAGVRAQLEGLGVTVVDVATCTRESPDLYSYRRDGAAAGRFAGLIRRRPRE